MASENAYDAIKTYLTDHFGGTYAIRDWEEIEVALQQGTDPFLALDGGAGSTGLQSIGTPDSNWVEDTGTAIIHTFVPVGGGLAPARAIAEQIRVAMQFARLVVPAGETMRVVTIDPPSDGVVHDGLWHSMLVAVSYEHRYTVQTDPV